MISRVDFYLYLVWFLVTTSAVQSCKVGGNCTYNSGESKITLTTAISAKSLNEGTALKHGCVLSIPTNVLAFVSHDPSSQIANGTVVQDLTPISYKCAKGNALFGSLDNVCFNGTWTSPLPECSRTCSSKPLQGITFTALCKYKGLVVDCNDVIRPGTIAIINCAIGYRNSNSTPDINVIHCAATGDWDYLPSRCEATCGEEPISFNPFAGELAKSNVPWLVAVYKQSKDDPLLICGGTIISAKLVVTAASCFPRHENQAQDPRQYLVVSGKTHRNFHTIEQLPTQITNVSEIIISDKYMDYYTYYHFDIALLVLEMPIEFRRHIKPICIQWEAHKHDPIASGIVGKIEGWGRLLEHSKYSETRKSIWLETYSKEDCLKKIPSTYEQLINADKFCARPQDGEDPACEGDSGGGLAVPKSIDGVTKYFLWGVLSTSLSERTCGTDSYVALTNIQYHRGMITEYLTKFRAT